jgi:hypothetical protein
LLSALDLALDGVADCLSLDRPDQQKAGAVYLSLPPSVGARFMIGRMRWSPMSDNVLWLVAAAETGLVVTFLVLVMVMMPS